MVVKEDSVSEIVSSFDLPPLPKIAHALIQMLGDPDVDVHDLAGVISVEPVLSSRLIKVANSSLYGQTTTVTNAERAAVILGLGYVKALCLANQLAAPLSRIRLDQIDAEAFWRDALLRACIGRQLGRSCKGGDPELAFLAGLLMDIAIPALLSHFGQEYQDIHAKLGSHQVDLDLWERENIELTHADLAGAILSGWNLPTVITEAIKYHHTARPLIDDKKTLVLQRICYFIAALPLGASAPRDSKESSRSTLAPIADALRLDADTIARALHAARCECETIVGLFDNLLPPETDIAEVLVGACQCLCETDPELFRQAFN